MNFGERLEKTRKNNNLTQEQLASLLDVSRQTISKWESNEFYPEIDRLILISKKLDVSLDYLILGKIEKQNNTKNIIYVESEADTVVSAVYKFVIRDIAFAKENTGVPVCILGGVDKHGIFGDHEIILGYYATKDDAKKELQEILNAIDCGKNIYKLKYNSELKGTKLKVIK